jgi:hypothetical protein
MYSTLSAPPSPTPLSSDADMEYPHWSGSASASLIPIGSFPSNSPSYNPICTHARARTHTQVPQSQLITSALKMETACFSEMLASTSQATRQFNPKDHHQKCYHMKILNLIFNMTSLQIWLY